MNKPRFATLFLLGLVLAPRLLVLLTSNRTPEPFEYETIVQNLLAGRGYMEIRYGTAHFSSFCGWPYILLTTLIYTVTGHSQTAMLLTQCLTSSVLTLVIHSLGQQIGGNRVGWLAAALVAFHPGLVYYDTHKLHPLSFDALLIASSTLALSRLMINPSIRRYAAAGLLSGVAVLERGTFIPVVGICLVVLSRMVKNHRLVMVGTTVFLLCGGLIVTPWLVRNFIHYRVLVLQTSNGEHLWRGNNPGTSGSALTPDGRSILQAADPAFREQLYRLDEIHQMRFFVDAAQQYIVEHPWTTIVNLAKRWGSFVWFSPMSGLLYPRRYLRFYQLYYAAMLAAALMGLVHLRQRAARLSRAGWITLLLLAGVWVVVGLAQGIGYVEIRHRWGVEGLMLVFSAIGILHLFHLLPRSATARCR